MTVAWVSIGIVMGAIIAYCVFRFRSVPPSRSWLQNLEGNSQALEIETSRLYEREIAAVRSDEILLDNIRKIGDPHRRLQALARFSAKRNPP